VRLAWFSPLPPHLSGIADYSHEILPLVAERADVDVYSPRAPGLRRLRVPLRTKRLRPSAFPSRAGSYDALFYHLGNNPWHAFMYQTVLAHPGIVVFHDFVMHHLIAQMYVESHRDRAAYQSVLESEYGSDGTRLSELRFRGAADEFEKFLFPLNAHLARSARAIVVHNRDALTRMSEIAPGVPAHVIPHHAGTPPASVEGVGRDEARRRLKLPDDAFVVGHFGYVTRPKQPGAVLGGFAKLAEAHPEARLLMVGSDNTGGAFARQVRRLGLEGKAHSAGFVDLERFYLYLKAVDAVISLRYPSAGESSGTFARALAEGRPAIVNNLGSFAEIPPDVALKVEVDGPQAEEVGVHLIRLAEDEGFRRAIGANARRYAAEVLDQRHCRDLYLELAEASA
jgi:glycosyltransferase involved in cell wall biosynthesis